ncbi:hypothetical protein BVRB_9g220900 [Beta vulgaris subsp. vulgaris]|nr:hypothetical protein BVRB_9g220900 [Beta vulgaris subsp. vulgaris]
MNMDLKHKHKHKLNKITTKQPQEEAKLGRILLPLLPPAASPSYPLHQKVRLPPSKPHLASSPISFHPTPPPRKNPRLSGVVVGGVVAGSILAVAALTILFILLFKRWRARTTRIPGQNKEIELGTSTVLLDP